ncbi:hypothetical protein [Roseibium algae]|uniref:Uncharacterized protein n=1 Tax=Roseibium algae TaxID=3123038 RepID=A0ABU8TNC0_9HYPH
MKRTLWASALILGTAVGTALVGGFGSTQVSAATFNDPTWPCLQRKVENLSLGLMWPVPLKQTETTSDLPDGARELAAQLALRRISIEDAEPLVNSYIKAHSDINADRLGQIFEVVFEKLAKDRRRIISGIGRYSEKQITLAGTIDETRAEMDRLMSASSPDFDAVDKLEEKLDWDERIYRDRARSLTYVCETPVLLEKRLYAIAKLLSKHASDGE